MLGEMDEALASATCALEIAGRLGDQTLRIPATTYLEQAHYHRGEYDRVVELAIGNLASLPADWVDETLECPVPASVYDRCLAGRGPRPTRQIRGGGRASSRGDTARRPTQHAYTIGFAHFAGSMLHLLKGDWVAGALTDRALDHADADRELRLPPSFAACLLRLATGAARREERGAEPAPGGRAAPRPSAGREDPRPSRLGLPRAWSRLSAARPARRGAASSRPWGRNL